MKKENVKRLIRKVLRIGEELSYYGGAENAPVLWNKYAEARAKLLAELHLPQTQFYKKILESPYGSTKARKLSNRLVSFHSVKEVMAEMGISTSEDFLYFDAHRELHIDYLYDKLLDEIELSNENQEIDKEFYLYWCSSGNESASDVLLTLKVKDQPYTRFLIHTILNKRYGSPRQIVWELKRITEPKIEQMFTLYYSKILSDHQKGEKQLQFTSLRFIKQFLWMNSIEPPFRWMEVATFKWDSEPKS